MKKFFEIDGQFAVGKPKHMKANDCDFYNHPDGHFDRMACDSQTPLTRHTQHFNNDSHGHSTSGERSGGRARRLVRNNHGHNCGVYKLLFDDAALPEHRRVETRRNDETIQAAQRDF